MSSGTRLFVSNLPEYIEENDLRNAFSPYGDITSLDLKNKSATSDEQRKFAFITIEGSNYNIESCIKYFSNEYFKGHKLYVTRARESFLERLQRERDQTRKQEIEKSESTELEQLPKSNPVIKLSEKLNPRKRKLLENHSTSKTQNETNTTCKQMEVKNLHERKNYTKSQLQLNNGEYFQNLSENQNKKLDSEKKRMESMKKKRQEFKEKKMIIKTGLTGVDTIHNKKILFSDTEDNDINIMNGAELTPTPTQIEKKSLFADNDSGDELNFEINEHLEGKNGQKILDLQSRYKSDKRFKLDERFIQNEEFDNDIDQKKEDDNEDIQLEQTNEKIKQLNILQDVLGVVIKPKSVDLDNKKMKNKLGMLRFDPTQPDHEKFIVSINEAKQESQKKSKKKLKDKKEDNKPEEKPHVIEETVEVSKEQFYKVSETLKETITNPASFSLRSLFTKNEDVETDLIDQKTSYIPITTKKTKIKNPLDPGEKNPFVYDSSDSETEEEVQNDTTNTLAVNTEKKAVWKENLFFSQFDNRLRDGLEFFSKIYETDMQKERRELKSLMKKRIYNKERKSQKFQKKIGGRKKTMKKNFRKQ